MGIGPHAEAHFDIKSSRKQNDFIPWAGHHPFPTHLPELPALDSYYPYL